MACVHCLRLWALRAALVFVALWLAAFPRAWAQTSTYPAIVDHWTLTIANGGGTCSSSKTFSDADPTSVTQDFLAYDNQCQSASYTYVFIGCAAVSPSNEYSVACQYQGHHKWDSGVDPVSSITIYSVANCGSTGDTPTTSSNAWWCAHDPGLPAPNNGQCPPDGKSAGDWDFNTGQPFKTFAGPVSGPWYTCSPYVGPSSGGCTVKIVGSMAYESSMVGELGNANVTGPGTFTGQPCSLGVTGDGTGPGTAAQASSNSNGTGSTPSATSGPGNCAPGQAVGYVNDVATCYTPSSSTPTIGPTVTGSVTSSSPSGTSTTGTQSQTTCDGSGVCTTNTTTTVTINSGGTTTTSVTTGSQSEGLDSYCKSNPKDPQCGSSSEWGGSCASGFTGSGYAVMVAAAQAAWQQKCALVDGPSVPNSEQTSFSAAKQGGSGYSLGTSTVAISSANFDSSNSIGVGAACVSDMTVSVWGTSQTIALSQVCPWLQTLGTIMLSLAWLSAALIVGKGVAG